MSLTQRLGKRGCFSKLSPKKQVSSLDSQKLQKVLKDYFAGQSDVLVAYLFGSQASLRARDKSDVDIAVLLSKEENLIRFERRLQLIDEVSEVCKRKADVVVLNDAPPLLQHQVLKNKKMIFDRDPEERIEFEVRAGKVYADLKPMYDFHTVDVIQKIKEVGLSGRRRCYR